MMLIDNINQLLGDDLKQTLVPSSRLKIAASCFSMYAYEALKKELSNIDSLEFIFTSPTFVADEVTDKLRKERREFFIPKAGREKNIYGSEFEIRLKNQLTQKALARECVAWIRNKARFRSNTTDAQMQAFACVHTDDQDAVYMPLQGFTATDLGYQQSNAVSNFLQKLDQPAMTAPYLHLFQQIWTDAEKLQDVTETICRYMESAYQENAPAWIYFFMLYHIFHEFLDDVNDDVLPNDHTGYQNTLIWQKLFNFQQDAATGIINRLETWGGCILADSVGLGKTFTALAVIKYYELRNRSVLVLCPKKIADNWFNYNRNLKTNLFAKDRFRYDVFCHTDLDRSSGESFGTPLNRVNWGNYDLVVIDESHNFRNDDAVKGRETRYQKLMNNVIKDGVKTRVLMLSATPVNNRFGDLRNQLALAYEGHSANLSKHLKTHKSVEEIFRNAQTAFNRWSKLKPDQRTTEAILDALDFDFFELLDSVTIARSRKHIQRFYDTSAMGHFPKREKPLAFRPPLTHRDDVMSFDDIVKQLHQLKLAVYAPLAYILPSRYEKYAALYDTDVKGGRGKLRQTDREKSLVALMTTNLLKRLESSVDAFRKTLQSLYENHRKVLDSLASFHHGSTDELGSPSLEDLNDLDTDDEAMFAGDGLDVGTKIRIKLGDMDRTSWQRDLQADQHIIQKLLESMHKIKPQDDAKLEHLKAHITEKITHPINPGNRKVLVFTAFADTAEYLYHHVASHFEAHVGLHTALVTGGSGLPKTTLHQKRRKGYDIQEILTLFSPKSKAKNEVLPDEPQEIDLLIGTDCISEGQNLQDCDYVINYDIHWNPVRIIQRFGRVDRIGSTNQTIQLVNYWPAVSLDAYINLKQRVENRMTIVDVTATGDDNLLCTKESDLSYRKEQLRRLQEEVIELEDVKTGVSMTDLGLNEFRMDLLAYIKQFGEPRNQPHGMHAVVPAQPEIGLLPGVIFALKHINAGVHQDRQNRLHPYYLMYVDNHGDLIASHLHVKHVLDVLRRCCKDQQQPIPEVCQIFNQATDDGRQMVDYSNLLSQAIASMIDVKAEKDIDSLFSGGATSAMVNPVTGLGDVELLAFIVVQGDDPSST